MQNSVPPTWDKAEQECNIEKEEEEEEGFRMLSFTSNLWAKHSNLFERMQPSICLWLLSSFRHFSGRQQLK